MHSRFTRRHARRGRRGQRAAALALTVVSAMALAACGGGDDDGGSSGGKITLKVATYGDFGYTDAMFAQYEKDHPGIKVETSVAASSEDARTNMLTKLAAGSGLADVEAVEISWVAQLRQYAELFQPVEDDDYGDWVGYQKDPVTLDDDTLFGYGVATGPEAMCYRADLLEQAGMPSDPDSVAAMVGDWDSFFAAGEQYAAGGGKAWFDSAYMIYNAQVEQLEYPYENADDEIVAASDPEVETVFRDTLAVAPTQSAHLEPFSEDWAAATANGGFAVMACPSWMLGVIEGNASEVTTWKIANAFPGGGGNVGGSFLVVPKQSNHAKEAAELASWLTAPAQQIEAFKNAGPFPSRVDALDDPALADITNAYFGDAPVGTTFADRTEAIDTVMYKGPHYLAIDAAIYGAITRVESGQQSVDDSWDQFVDEVKGIE
jgi:cellobiose transport system substrate-binding protein